MAKTRAIRFSDKEEKLIQDFLKQNPFFDFSSLARTSILKFIHEPSLRIKAVRGPRRPLNERSS
jgi:hypothetical protein